MMATIFAKHLRAGAAFPAGLIASHNPMRRFSIYSNNVVHSLTMALATRFPATQRLLGTECFKACAQLFVDRHKPTTPILMFYGDDFPAYLATLPNLSDWPFLADVARIEAARTYAYHAADQAPLRLEVGDAAEIESYLKRVLRPHPSAHVFHSPYPAATIWAASGSEAELSEAELLPETWRDETIAITRSDYEVHITLVPPGTAACMAAIGKTMTLGEAIATACDMDEAYDPASILVALLRCNLLAAPQQENEHENSS